MASASRVKGKHLLLLFLAITWVQVYFSFYYHLYDLLALKYALVNIIGASVVAFTFAYSLLDIKNSFLFFISSIPILTWYKSVFYFPFTTVLIDPYVLILPWFCFLMLFLFLSQKRLTINPFLGLFSCVFFIKLIASPFGTYPINEVSLLFIINEFLEPFLFVFSLMLFWSVHKNPWHSLEKVITGIACSSAIILFTEMILRSNGKPWLFLIYGGRRGYSGTTGDLTAGFGEPVMMGIFSAFLLPFSVFIIKNKKISIYLIFLVALSVAKSAFLIVVIFFLGMTFILKEKIWQYLNKKQVSTLAILCTPLLYVVYQRILGIGESDTLTGMQLGSLSFSTDLNLVRNLIAISTWADSMLELSWYKQALLLPVAGGIKNTVYLNSNIIIFLSGMLINIIIFMRYFVTGNKLTKVASFILLLVFSYYGAFMGNPYSFYFEINEPHELGYTPRNEPYFLFILILLTLEYSRNHLYHGKENFNRK